MSSAERTRDNERRLHSYARDVSTYDEEMDLFEKWIIGTGHRNWACSRAFGVTLEVAIGTGLNLAHFPSDLSLIGVDLSPEMLSLANARAQRMSRRLELHEADAQNMPTNFANGGNV